MGGGRPKFCIIGLAPYQFQLELRYVSLNFHEITYLPILGYDKMEFFGTKRGEILNSLLSSKYRKFLDRYEMTNPNFADVDGWRGLLAKEQYHITTTERLELGKGYRIYRKNYPDTVKFNLNCLDRYLNLCHSRNIVPFGVLFPFSIPGRRAYPTSSVMELRELLSTFKDKMYFIDMWNVDLPDSDFRNVSHLKISGARKVTEIIRQYVERILS